MIARSDRARTDLLQEITEGRFANEERLPGERDLAALLSVSRTTLRRAIESLVADGVLSQRQGFGTYIRRTQSPHGGSAVPPASTRFMTLGDELRLRDESARFVVLLSEYGPPFPAESMALAVLAPRMVWRAVRLWTGREDRPLAYEEITAAEVALSAANETDETRLARLGQSVVLRHRRVRLQSLDGKPAAQLDVQENTIGLFLEERALDEAGRCRLYSRLTQRAEHLDLAYGYDLDPLPTV